MIQCLFSVAVGDLSSWQDSIVKAYKQLKPRVNNVGTTNQALIIVWRFYQQSINKRLLLYYR